MTYASPTDSPWDRYVAPDERVALARFPSNGQADLVEAARARFTVLTRDDLDAIPAPDPIIDGLLPGPRSLVLLAGSRGLGKSLLSLDVSGCLSTDLPTFYGHEVRHHGPVLYVSREGFPAVPERVRAWEAWRGRRLDNVLWLPDAMDLKRPADARQVGALAADLGVVAVFLDSARATGSGKEDTADMGEYVMGLETVRDLSGAMVVALHNTGWDKSRERGSTLLPDACDTALIVEGDMAGRRSLKHTKHRDGSMLTEPLWFAWQYVEGTTSGVLVPADAPVEGVSLGTQLLGIVIQRPGLSTGALAIAVDRPRGSVSRTLGELRSAGLIVNGGTTQSPSWEVSA